MSTGKFVGKTLAKVQHLIDSVFEWGFNKLKEQGEKPRVVNPDDKFAGLKSTVRKGVDFLGTAGTEFYDEYERLKKKKQEKKSEKKQV